MAQRRVVSEEGLFCTGTDIDFIDKQWPQSLAYFSWMHLEWLHDSRDEPIKRQQTNSAGQKGPIT